MKHIVLFISSILLTTACGGDTTNNTYNYYSSSEASETGGRTSADTAMTSTGGSAAANQTFQVSIDGGLPSDADTQSCVLDRIKEFGPALQTFNLVGGPSGFLATWTTDWTANVSVQAFDQSGSELNDRYLLTDSDSGAYPIIGSKRGYLVNVSGKEPRLVRIGTDGKAAASDTENITASVHVELADGDPQELSVTNYYYPGIDTTTHGSATELYYVSPDASRSRIDEYLLPSIPSNEDWSLSSVAQNGDAILLIFEHDISTLNSPPQIQISELSYVLYSKERHTFSQPRTLHESLAPEASAFIVDAQPTAEGFSVVWGMNETTGSLRYITTVRFDGSSDVTHDISGIVGGWIHIVGDRLIMSVYEEVMKQRSFRMASLTGEVFATLPISQGQNYYLGYPNVATDGKGAYAMGWIEQNADADYSTTFKIAFFHCKE